MYLTLPSNSSHRFFPGNTLANFITQLPRTINMEDGSWEVGLSEIQYPHTWYNVTKTDGWILIQTSEDVPVYKCELKEGQYKDASQLIESITNLKKVIPKADETIVFTFDHITQKVSIKINPRARLILSPALTQILGLKADEFGHGFHMGERVIDVHQGFYSLYVYCSLVEPRVVGDVEVPLLRIVPVQGNDGEVITKSYENVQYLPLLQKSFNTVEIDIKKDTGDKVPFERGKLVVTLHFRRRRI